MSAPQITGVRVDVPAGRVDVVAVPGRGEVSVVVNPMDRSRAGDVAAAESAQVERVGDTIVVTVPARKPSFGRPDRVDVIVEGPEGLNVDVATKHGEIRTAGPLGRAHLSAQYGAVKVEAADDVEVNGGHGKVSLGQVRGNATVHVSNGASRIDAVHGDLSVRSSNGSIAVQSVAGAATVETTNGSIRVGESGGGLEARSSNGRVRIGALTGGLCRVETSMGSVKVGVRRGVPVWLDASSGHGKVVTELDADEGPVEGEVPVELHVRTGYGAVVVQRA